MEGQKTKTKVLCLPIVTNELAENIYDDDYDDDLKNNIRTEAFASLFAHKLSNNKSGCFKKIHNQNKIKLTFQNLIQRLNLD